MVEPIQNIQHLQSQREVLKHGLTSTSDQPTSTWNIQGTIYDIAVIVWRLKTNVKPVKKNNNITTAQARWYSNLLFRVRRNTLSGQESRVVLTLVSNFYIGINIGAQFEPNVLGWISNGLATSEPQIIILVDFLICGPVLYSKVPKIQAVKRPRRWQPSSWLNRQKCLIL